MICDHLTSVLGFECTPLAEGGSIALVSTPFRFDDGDPLPVFVELVGSHVRFFDDGQTLMHFIGRGVRVETRTNATFLTNAAGKSGATFTESGELEAWAPVDQASEAFAKFLSSLMSLSAWENDQRGINSDTSLFVEEVAIALKAWKPNAALLANPAATGVSGREYRLDFEFDGSLVVATSAHANAVSSVLHRLVDIKGKIENADVKFLVVIDDRTDPDAAMRESLIVQSVATVMPYQSIGRYLPGDRVH